MIGHLINLVFRGTSIYRWNNFPRIENISTTDHLAFTLHITTLLSAVLKEKEGIEIDELYIFKKIIFDSFMTLVMSDINSDVKNRIKQKDLEIYKKLEKRVYDFLLGGNIPKSIKEEIDFTQINKNNGKYSLEHDLIAFSKQVAISYEVLTNSKVYPTAYENVLKSIESKLNGDNFKIFLKYIPVSNINNKLEKYLLNVRRLQSNYRWNMHKKIYPISVMSHLYITMFLVYIIGKIEEKSEKDLLLLLKIALFHDIPEAITGDIVGPTKRAVEGLEHLISQVESEMLEEYLMVYLDEFKFKNEFNEFMLNPWVGDLGKLAKMADIFSGLFEAKIEVVHNEKFGKIYKNMVRYIHDNFEFKSADYILKYGIEYFDDNMEEIIKL